MRTDQDRNGAEYQRALDTIERLLSNPPIAIGNVAEQTNREDAAALRHVRTMLHVGRACQQVVDQLAPLCPCNAGPDTDGPEQDCPIHGDGETFVMLCRWRDAVVVSARLVVDSWTGSTIDGAATVDDDAVERLRALLDAGPWGGPDTDAAVAATLPPATIGRDELARLRGIEARAQRILDMEPGVALPGSQATALAILDGPSPVDPRVRLRALTDQVNSAAHRRLAGEFVAPRTGPWEF